MKSEADHYTLDLLGNKPGRPRKPSAKRARECGQRSTAVTPDHGPTDLCPWCGAKRSSCCGICTIGQLGRKG